MKGVLNELRLLRHANLHARILPADRTTTSSILPKPNHHLQVPHTNALLHPTPSNPIIAANDPSFPLSKNSVC